MTFSLNIDLKFGIDHGLSMHQLMTLSAFMKFHDWTEKIWVDNDAWYRYSDAKMSADYPSIFSVPKKCYKNVAELVKMGYMQTIKVNNRKYYKFTSKCSSWCDYSGDNDNARFDDDTVIVQNRTTDSDLCKESKTGPVIVQNRTGNSPKPDREEPKTGPVIVQNRTGKSPKLDAYYNINIYHDINDNKIKDKIIDNNKESVAVCTALTPQEDEQSPLDIEKKKEKSCAKKERTETMFRDSDVFELVTLNETEDAITDDTRLREKFGQQYMGVDLSYYFLAILGWSDMNRKIKRTDVGWLQTFRQWIKSDNEKGKLHMLAINYARDDFNFL